MLVWLKINLLIFFEIKYKVSEKSGPKHNLVFKVEVQIENHKIFSAIGSSKKDAEQNAAKKLINFLKI